MIIASFVAPIAQAQAQEALAPTIRSEFPDYAPGDQVKLIGEGWQAGEVVNIYVDDSLDKTWTNNSSPDDPIADGNGYFEYSFGISANFVATYTVFATGSTGATATTTFTDTPIDSNFQLEQWETDASPEWITGNLGSNNSVYKEGDAVPFRLTIPANTPTTDNPITFSVCRDYSNGTTRGYLYLDTYDKNYPADAGGTISDTEALPNGVMSGVNLTFDSVTEVGGQGGCGAGMRETQVSVNITSSTPRYVLWSGHLAKASDIRPGESPVGIVGAGNSAGNYPGSSLAMRIKDSAKNRSINPDAIIELPYITAQKVVDSGSATPDQWCFNISPNPNNETLPKCPPTGGDTVQFLDLPAPAAQYTITETTVSGYVFASGTGTNCTFSGSTATASVAGGTAATNATCVFHNKIKNSPGLTTLVRRASNNNEVTDGANVPFGTSLYDTAALTGATATAGGTVQYFVSGPMTQVANDTFTCATGTSLGTKTVTNGSIPNSDATGALNGAGIYEFWAVYSGDTNNDGKTSTCKSETVVVDRAGPAISTQVRDTNGTVDTGNDSDISNGGHVSIGTKAYDTASVTGGSSPTGTVQFYVEKGDASCTVDGATDLGSKALGSASDTYEFTSAGTYYFWAVYSGDVNNTTQTSACNSEAVVVDRNVPDTLTQVKNTNGTVATDNDTNITNGGHVGIGTVAYDTATVGGGTGTVQFYVEKGDDQCTTTGASSLGSKAVGTASDTYEFTAAGTYYFWAVYSGDANNDPVTSACNSETVVVDQNTTTVTTQVKNTKGTAPKTDDTDISDGANVAIGTEAYDTASFGTSATSDAGGTVTYKLYKSDGDATDGTTCDNLVAAFGTNGENGVTVLNGAIPDSAAFTFTAAGTYEFVAVYSGDANNKDDSSACGDETVVVDQNTTTVTTQLKRSSDGSNLGSTSVDGNAVVGESVYDTATLGSATSDAGGTVTYYYKLQTSSTASCTGGTAIDSNGNSLGAAVTVSNRVVPDSADVALSSAGTYEFWAVYSGDANNTGSTSGCGAETVIVTVASQVTNTELCTFDMDPNAAGDNIRLNYTQDTSSTYKLNASNPGQFYYNVFVSDPGSTTVTMTIPYPFVTQGAVPIHAYSSVQAVTKSDGSVCYIPGPEVANWKQYITISSYPVAGGFAQTASLTFTSSTGFAYINMHLDYGLKGMTGWQKQAVNPLTTPVDDAVGSGTSAGITILNGQSYAFSVIGDANSTDSVTTLNIFKKNPGIGGLVLKTASGDPVPGNTKIQVYNGTKLMGTVYTDQDGYYMWGYKWTGKAATFTVKVPSYSVQQSKTLKANGFLDMSFQV